MHQQPPTPPCAGQTWDLRPVARPRDFTAEVLDVADHRVHYRVGVIRLSMPVTAFMKIYKRQANDRPQAD